MKIGWTGEQEQQMGASGFEDHLGRVAAQIASVFYFPVPILSSGGIRSPVSGAAFCMN